MTLNHNYRVRSQATYLNQKVEFGVHIRHVGPGGSTEDLLDSWVANAMPLVLAASSSSVNWDRVTVSDTAEGGDEALERGLTQPNPGLVAGEPLPPQNSMLVSLRTGVSGRRHRGRFYLPGISEANTTNGLVTGTQLTALQALASGLVGLYGTGGTESNYRLVVYSPEQLTPPPPKPFKERPGLVVTHINNAIASDVVRTQRHRAFGVGR